MLCCAKSLQSCPALCDAMNCSPPGSSVHGDSPGKSTGVGCHALLQRIFWTQGLNPCLLWLLHCRQILYCSATREALRPKESIAKKSHESDPHICFSGHSLPPTLSSVLGWGYLRWSMSLVGKLWWIWKCSNWRLSVNDLCTTGSVKRVEQCTVAAATHRNGQT